VFPFLDQSFLTITAFLRAVIPVFLPRGEAWGLFPRSGSSLHSFFPIVDAIPWQGPPSLFSDFPSAADLDVYPSGRSTPFFSHEEPHQCRPGCCLYQRRLRFSWPDEFLPPVLGKSENVSLSPLMVIIDCPRSRIALNTGIPQLFIVCRRCFLLYAAPRLFALLPVSFSSDFRQVPGIYNALLGITRKPLLLRSLAWPPDPSWMRSLMDLCIAGAGSDPHRS